MYARCAAGRLLARCGREAVAACQYCGRWFCELHGESTSIDHQICDRPRCHEKERDLAEHLVFRERALLRNRHGLCGMDGCLEPLAGQCSKCEGTYCEEHLSKGTETVREGIVRVTRPAAFCEHCRRRRKLWSRL
jgi:predicted nucleic acid binding AN1-type Zn finger protein